jgi:hypothetical protein
MNVQEFGLTGTGLQMCSRLSGVPFIAICGYPSWVPVYEMWFENGLGTGDWFLFDVNFKPPGLPHYPFGFDVDPDH